MAFPTTLDNFTNPTGSDTMDVVDHAGQHSNLNDAVEALETKVGINSSADTNSLDYKIANMMQTIYPIGALYTSTLSTNPATLLGFGTWTAFGAGRVMVGFDAGQTEFDTVEETGGAKTHTLTSAEMPSHTHTQNAHTHTQDAHGHSLGENGAMRSNGSAVGSSNLIGAGHYWSGTQPPNTTATNQNTTATNQNTGGDGAHNNLQPYIVVRMWKRDS